jgi:hypothetical protein
MKKILLISIALICVLSCANNNEKNSSPNPKDSTKLCMYRFKNKFLDLQNLKWLDSAKAMGYTVIVREENYVSHFGVGSNQNKKKNENLTFELNENRDITISDSKGKLLKTITENDKKTVTDLVSGNSVLFSIPTGVICAIRLAEERGYRIIKYDENGKILNTWKIAHTLYKKDGNMIESIPYLYFFGHTNSEMIFTGVSYSKPMETLILNLNDGSQKKSTCLSAGMIFNPADGNLAGLVQYNRDAKIFIVEIGSEKWEIPNESYQDAAKTVLADSILVIAQYCNIATGCSVNAYHANTGKLLWAGDVKQMMVGHSKYFNVVHLTLFQNKLILEGNEAYGDYVQVLDLKTGKNLFSEMPEANR